MHASDLFADIQRELDRPDLQAVGILLVQTRERGTQMCWCLPGVTDLSLLGTTIANAQRGGGDLGGFIAGYERTARVFIRPPWRHRGGPQKDLHRLCRDMQKQGTFGVLERLRVVPLAVPRSDS